MRQNKTKLDSDRCGNCKFYFPAATGGGFGRCRCYSACDRNWQVVKNKMNACAYYIPQTL